MHFLRVICLAGAAFLPIGPAWSQASAVFPDPQSFAAELRRLEKMEGEGRGTEVSASLPPEWFVETPGHRYAISTDPLRQVAGSPDRAENWLEELAREVESYAATALADASTRRQLDHILARREFAGAKPPSPLELFWRAIGAWIRSLLDRMFRYAGQHSTGGKVLFWTGAVAAILFLGAMLYRLWGDRSRIAGTESSPAIPEWTWRQWVVLARQAADRGDLRSAIQCAYWAGVVRLQDEHLLPADLTRTPREYLRLLPDHANTRAPLSGLTMALERFWYAGGAAGADDLRESFRYLEALGCRLD